MLLGVLLLLLLLLMMMAVMAHHQPPLMLTMAGRNTLFLSSWHHRELPRLIRCCYCC
jgi:hypothetical protein